MTSPFVDVEELKTLIIGMRAAFARGENAMEWVRQRKGHPENTAMATLIAYDLQAGGVLNCGRAGARSNPEAKALWCHQLAAILEPFVTHNRTLLEVGCGEAITLTGVLRRLSVSTTLALGFDISWSRVAEGMAWLEEQKTSARLFVADLFEIPLEKDSVDVIYTAHSLEPNGGREEEAIRELLRVARQTVVLIEPMYELADEDTKRRMVQHGYVRGLRDTAERLGANIMDYRLLRYSQGNPLNPSGVLLLDKCGSPPVQQDNSKIRWRCPVTHTPLTEQEDVMISTETGLVYPILRGVPLLRAQHAVVASRISCQL